MQPASRIWGQAVRGFINSYEAAWPNLNPDPIDYNIAQIDQLLVKGSKEISLEFRYWIWGQVDSKAIPLRNQIASKSTWPTLE